MVSKGINGNVSLVQSNDSEESSDVKWLKTRAMVQTNNPKRER